MPLKEYILLSAFISITSMIFGLLLNERVYYKWGLFVWSVITFAYITADALSFFFMTFLFLLVMAMSRKKNITESVTVYLLLLPLMPLEMLYIIPFPGQQQFLIMTYQRLLNLMLLLPLFLMYIKDNRYKLFTRRLDWYVALFLTYIWLVSFRDTTFTNAIRTGFYIFVDYFLVYFVMSRVIIKIEDFKKLFYPMVFVAVLLGMIAIFEMRSHWLLYSSLVKIVMKQAPTFIYLMRYGFVRASASFLAPIALGVYFCLMAGLAAFLGYSEPIYRRRFFGFIAIFFFGAILATSSRGPMIGYIVLFAFFLMLSPSKIRKLLPVLVIALLVFITFFADKRMAQLAKDRETVIFRQNLLTNSIDVIARSPLTGTGTYLEETKMQDLMAAGIIDVVNSYLGIALRYGLIGLGLFLAIFFKVIKGFEYHIRHAKGETEKLLGKILVSAMASFMIMIYGVSSVSLIPCYMWVLLGISASYVKSCEMGG